MSTVKLTLNDYNYVTFTYSVTSTATTTTLKVTNIAHTCTRSSGTNYAYWVKGLVAGSAKVSGTISKGGKTRSWAVSHSASWSRGSSAQSKSVAVRWVQWRSGFSESSPNYDVSGVISVSVPALPTYTNTYKANGGTGSDQTQTHMHGSPFTTKASSTFSRTNYEFSNWNTASGGGGTNYSANTAYTVNSSLTLYAIWTQVYASPQISITKAYRCDANGDADDEGTYAAIEYSFQIWNTSTTNTATVTAEVDDGGAQHPSATSSTFTASGTGGGWSSSTGKLVVNANMQTENSYMVSATVTDTQGNDSQSSHPGRTDASAYKSAQISTAFYLMDFLGDRYLYNLTEDLAIDSEKTYYTRSGSGTSVDPYSYTVVENPDVSDISSYYEANGPRPGHGICFGGAASSEVASFHMPIDVHGTERLLHPTIDRGNTPSSNIYGGGGALAIVDKNGDQIGYLQPVQLTDGTEGIQLGASNGDNTDWNTLQLAFNGNTPTVGFGKRDSWLNALGFTASYTSTASNVLSAGSGITISSVHFVKYGGIGMLAVLFKYNTSMGSGDIANIKVATLKSGYRPYTYAALGSFAGGSVQAFANSSGEIFIATTGGSIAANKEIWLGGTYILG